MKRLGLRRRTILLYILVAVIPTILIFAFYTANYLKVAEEDTVTSVLQTLKQAAINIENSVSNAERIADGLFMNEEVRTALKSNPKEQTVAEQMAEMSKVRNIKKSSASSDVRSIRFFINDDKMYANDRIDFFKLSEFYNNDIFADASPRGSWLTTYDYKYLDESSPIRIVSLVRLINDIMQFNNTIGAMVIDIEEASIFSPLQEIDFPGEYLVYVVDSEGMVISSHEELLYGTSKKDILPQKIGDESIVSEMDGSYYIIQPIAGSDWRLMAEIPRSSIRTGYLNTRSSLFLYLLLLIVFIGGMLIVMVANVAGVSKRVQSLSSMLQTERGSMRAADESSLSIQNAFGLYKSLDQSLEDTHLLIETLYFQMEEQKRTQLQLLQSQINPHFLYNTLDTVQWMVRTGDKENAESAIRALTQYLRLILNNGQDEVTVVDEVKLAEAYISIQRQRFGDSFDIEFIIEPEVQNCVLPKLSLQPVIENALTHGIFRCKNRRGRIDVDIYAESGELIISVTDNGMGMSSQQTKKLLQKPNKGGSGFGLYNVHQRLILFSGSTSYGISIESEEEKYTTVTLKMIQKKIL